MQVNFIVNGLTELHIGDRQAAKPPDAEASLRRELSAKIAGAQSDIESRLAELRATMLTSGNSGALTQAEAQLRSLASLQQRVARADLSSLPSLRADVAATVSAAQSAAQQPASAASSSQAQEAVLYQADQAARHTTADFMRDYYDRRIFDKYLKFTSREDEEEYRRREQERKREIEDARSQHTPDGDLRAVKLSIDQLKDAGAHGADRSAQYEPTMKKLQSTGAALQRECDSSSKTTAHERLEAATEQKAHAQPKLPADLLAGLKNAGVKTTDQPTEGHGLAACQAKQPGSRCPG